MKTYKIRPNDRFGIIVTICRTVVYNKNINMSSRRSPHIGNGGDNLFVLVGERNKHLSSMSACLFIC